ncbi:MAG: hypothetical protein ABSA67_05350 [Candidatus Brocadiia bacterium]|jgi:uncharacterized repeat protein (TIGR03943 family)
MNHHTIHRVVGAGRVAVILVWAVFLAFAWYTTKYPHAGKPGRLGIINPSYRWLSLASAATLILVSAALLPARRDEHEHHPGGGSDREGDHDHEEHEAASPGELVFQALFLAPIVLSLCSTGSGLSGASLSRRGVHEIQLPQQTQIRSAAPTARAPAVLAEPIKPAGAESEEVQPPLSMADLYEYLLTGAPAQWVGRPVDAIGQYFVDERCSANQFVVTRIVVTCCLADAEVIGVRAQSPELFKPSAAVNSSQRPQAPGKPLARVARLGPWIEVRGKLQALNDRFGNPALFIGDATVSEVPPPDDILLYPRRRKMPW